MNRFHLADRLFTAERWIFLFLNCSLLALILARKGGGREEKKKKKKRSFSERRAKYRTHYPVIGGWKARIVYARFHGNGRVR